MLMGVPDTHKLGKILPPAGCFVLAKGSTMSGKPEKIVAPKWIDEPQAQNEATEKVDAKPADEETGGTTPMAYSEAITEESVGIRAYANSAPGFHGVLKQRYSDFIVNEVDVEGKVVHLTALPVVEQPSQGEEERGAKRAKTVTGAASGGGEEAGEEAEKEEEPATPEGLASRRAGRMVGSLQEVAKWGEGDVARLEGEVRELLLGTRREVVFPPSEDKVARKAVHEYVKKELADVLSGDTVDDPQGGAGKCVRMANRSANLGGKRRRDDGPGGQRGGRGGGRGGGRMEQWPKDRPPQLQFTMYKENLTTTQAVSAICRVLRLSDNRICFAGMKDKRGVTTQVCTALKVSAEELNRLNTHGGRQARVLVGGFSYVPNCTKMGQLKGNRFKVVLRNVSADQDTVRQACEALAKSGFINYYGMQRFGSYGEPTSAIGVAMLKRNWRAVVDYVMRPRMGEEQRVADARAYFHRTKDAKGAAQRMPSYMNIEVSLLRALKPGQTQDFLPAIKAIPRNIQLMYLHAAQSELWNLAASHRVTQHPSDHVIAGDLVATDPDDVMKVHVVTEEEAAAGKYEVWDIVLPMPGGNVKYPKHTTGAHYEELLKERGLTFESLRNAQHREYSLSGTYRKLLRRAEDFKFWFRRYRDVSRRLLPTDADLLPQPDKAALGEAWAPFFEELLTEEEEAQLTAEGTEGTHVALCVEFTLESSTYATMLLRELMKTHVSADEMKKHNTDPSGASGGAEREAVATMIEE